MNRTYDKDFFEAWDRAREIEHSIHNLPKTKREQEAYEEYHAILEENGFAEGLDYQDCIRGYREKFHV